MTCRAAAAGMADAASRKLFIGRMSGKSDSSPARSKLRRTQNTASPFAGNQQYAILHRAGEIVLVDPAKERGQFPIRVLRIHPRPETLHPVRQL